MRNQTRWILALLAAGLAFGVAEKVAGETFDYNGNPDQPFPDAWGDPDVDCNDPHDPGESDCWICQGGSPAVAVPKFQWILTRVCPTFSMSNTVKSNCYCLLAGGTMSDSFTADYVATDGKKTYAPSIDGCGGESPEEEPITQDIEWTWSTSGLTTVPASGKEQTATFDYTVPEGAFSIEVVFSAKAKPSDTNCNEITAGPEVVGKITGGGYTKYIPPEIPPKNPTPEEVMGPIMCSGEESWGCFSYRLLNCLTTKPVCEGSDCSMCRIEGYFYLMDVRIQIATGMVVTAENCDLPIGSVRPRTEGRITESTDHEQLHLKLVEEFLAEWNAKISDLSLADSCDYAREILREFMDEFRAAYDDFKNDPHCPEYDGEQLYGFDGCNEVPAGRRNCN